MILEPSIITFQIIKMLLKLLKMSCSMANLGLLIPKKLWLLEVSWLLLLVLYQLKTNWNSKEPFSEWQKEMFSKDPVTLRNKEMNLKLMRRNHGLLLDFNKVIERLSKIKSSKFVRPSMPKDLIYQNTCLISKIDLLN